MQQRARSKPAWQIRIQSQPARSVILAGPKNLYLMACEGFGKETFSDAAAFPACHTVSRQDHFGAKRSIVTTFAARSAERRLPVY